MECTVKNEIIKTEAENYCSAAEVLIDFKDIVPSPDEQPSFAEAAVKNKKWFKIKSETLDTNSDIVEWNCKNIQYQFQSDKGNTSPIDCSIEPCRKNKKLSRDAKERRKERNRLNAANRRANETEQERKDRLYRNAVRQSQQRALQSEEKKQLRRLKQAQSASRRRAKETPEQREARRMKDLIRAANRRKQESEVDKKIRRYKNAVRASTRRSQETAEQRKRRNLMDLIRQARRRGKNVDEHLTRFIERRLKANEGMNTNTSVEENIVKYMDLASPPEEIVVVPTIFHDHQRADLKGETANNDNSIKIIPEIVWC